MFNARNRAPMTEPQNDICPISVFMYFMVNSNMKVKELLLNNMLTHLIEICKHELDLTELPTIELVDTPTVGGSPSFGVFDGDIKVVSKGRHPVDIMRTVAHELVHWKQRVSGMQLDGTTGSATENQANAVAGSIMRKFGEKYPNYFLDSLPSES